MNCGAIVLKITGQTPFHKVGLAETFYKGQLISTCQISEAEVPPRQQRFVFDCDVWVPIDSNGQLDLAKEIGFNCHLDSPGPDAQVKTVGFYLETKSDGITEGKLGMRFDSFGNNPYFKPDGAFGFKALSPKKTYFSDCTLTK